MFLVKVQYREALNLFDENRNHLEKSEDRTPVFIEVCPPGLFFSVSEMVKIIPCDKNRIINQALSRFQIKCFYYKRCCQKLNGEYSAKKLNLL